jgi:hypothetical protein
MYRISAGFLAPMTTARVARGLISTICDINPPLRIYWRCHQRKTNLDLRWFSLVLEPAMASPFWPTMRRPRADKNASFGAFFLALRDWWDTKVRGVLMVDTDSAERGYRILRHTKNSCAGRPI